ncbi:tetratricopeptide repeat protein [Chloroflexota bacterium]
MEDDKKFGARLKDLRIQAGMTLRSLAKSVNVDFTYLSKIENGVMPPPSEKVLLQIAEVLKTDRDELITLAGKIPSDIAEMLKDKETLQMLRSDRVQRKMKTTNKYGEKIVPKYIESAPKAPVLLRSFYRLAIPTILVLAVAISLWFAAPVTDTAIAANNQGLIYNNEGDYQKALVVLNKAIELDPGLALAYNNRGWSYIELGQFELAITDCNKAIELDPSLALAYSNRGRVYIELGQFELAITDCSKAIELDPDLALAYSNRGRAYIELGQYEPAIADFDKAMELDPNLQQ